MQQRYGRNGVAPCQSITSYNCNSRYNEGSTRLLAPHFVPRFVTSLKTIFFKEEGTHVNRNAAELVGVGFARIALHCFWDSCPRLAGYCTGVSDSTGGSLFSDRRCGRNHHFHSAACGQPTVVVGCAGRRGQCSGGYRCLFCSPALLPSFSCISLRFMRL